VIKDEPPAPLVYVPGSTTRDGQPVPDPEDVTAPGAGVPIASLAPKASAKVTYQVRAPVPSRSRRLSRSTARLPAPRSRHPPQPTPRDRSACRS
jgi:hypothetical protein